jgi:hypothetical protein
MIIAGFTVLACGAGLVALIAVGRITRSLLNSSERYRAEFCNIETPTPPGLERDAFLKEVRYAGEMPETLSVLDDDLSNRIRSAFSRHPWVESVDQVEIGPGNRIRVSTTFRVPVLAVAYSDGERRVRAVDRNGFLLPRAADTHALPHVAGPSPPLGPGKPWGDPQVEGSARVAGLLHEHRSVVRIKEFRWEEGALHLRREPVGGWVCIWGRAGDDPAEPSASTKLKVLLERIREDRMEPLDLRTLSKS